MARKMDVEKIRQDFPILGQKKPPIYFDNACMTLRPRQVIEAINRYYNEFPSCGERSMHRLGRLVTEEVDKARMLVGKFFNAREAKEVIFTKNTTEAINLIAHCLPLKHGDKVLTTDKEHNSNLVPWQLLAGKGVKHAVVKSKSDGTFDTEAFKASLDNDVKLVSMVYTSNLDGVTNPVREIIKIAHDHHALVLLDAAQAAPHRPIDVKALDVDFLACSGHKMLGPSGTGILYGKAALLEGMPHYIAGGGTVIDTTYDSFKPEKVPERFEAGLQDYAGIIGLGAAMQYLSKIGLQDIEKHETELNRTIMDGIKEIKGISIIGPADPALRGGIISFNLRGMDPHEIAMLLDRSANIAIRSGAHCVHSWFNAHGMKGSARASLYIYNTKQECQIFIEQLKKVASLVK
ncbi:MAG: cysteine desulfurase [Candidatus Aenigmatarchaeota archaeon]